MKIKIKRLPLQSENLPAKLPENAHCPEPP